MDPTTLNPYMLQMQQDQAAQGPLMQQAQTSMLGAGQAMSSYPSYPNQYGLGSQNPASGQGQAAPGTSYGAPPQPQLTQNAQDNTSRGFNPWSLIGESNARGG